MNAEVLNREIPQGVRHGVVARWCAGRRYGFVLDTEASREVFIHAADVPGRRPLRPGIEVTFVVQADAAGRPKCADVSLVGDGPWSIASGRLLGTVRRWNPRGFGFLAVEGEPDDVFCHVSQLTPKRDPAIGARVRLELSDANGRLVAVRVRVIENGDDDARAAQPLRAMGPTTRCAERARHTT